MTRSPGSRVKLGTFAIACLLLMGCPEQPSVVAKLLLQGNGDIKLLAAERDQQGNLIVVGEWFDFRLGEQVWNSPFYSSTFCIQSLDGTD